MGHGCLPTPRIEPHVMEANWFLKVAFVFLQFWLVGDACEELSYSSSSARVLTASTLSVA